MAQTLTANAPSLESAWRRRVVRWAPYLITAGVIAGLLTQFSPDEIARQVIAGDPWPLIPIAFVAVVVTLLMVGFADTAVVRGACGAGDYKTVTIGKAGAGMLDVFGYAAGHGAYAVWIGRFTGVRAGLAGGTMLYIVASDLLSVTAVAAVAAFLAPADQVGSVRIIAPVIAGTLVLCIALGPYELLGRGGGLFRPWSLIHRGIGYAQAAVRVAQIVFWVFMTWSASQAFGLDIPFWAMATYLPMIMLVGALPINVGGFGAVQGAWLLLADHASATEILAFNFVWTLTVSGGVIIRGLPFVKRVVEQVNAARREASERVET